MEVFSTCIWDLRLRGEGAGSNYHNKVPEYPYVSIYLYQWQCDSNLVPHKSLSFSWQRIWTSSPVEFEKAALDRVVRAWYLKLMFSIFQTLRLILLVSTETFNLSGCMHLVTKALQRIRVKGESRSCDGCLCFHPPLRMRSKFHIRIQRITLLFALCLEESNTTMLSVCTWPQPEFPAVLFKVDNVELGVHHVQ